MIQSQAEWMQVEGPTSVGVCIINALGLSVNILEHLITAITAESLSALKSVFSQDLCFLGHC